MRDGPPALHQRLCDTFAVVHRRGATLSPAARLTIELAATWIQTFAQPL